jgi:hypothetical protein
MKHAAVDILVSAADAITNRADQRDCETGERSMAPQWLLSTLSPSILLASVTAGYSW